jgi:hypothetical protein
VGPTTFNYTSTGRSAPSPGARGKPGPQKDISAAARGTGGKRRTTSPDFLDDEDAPDTATKRRLLSASQARRRPGRPKKGERRE